MATEDEHRLYTLLTMVSFDNDLHLDELREVVPKPQHAALNESAIDYRSGDGKPRQYRWLRLAEYTVEVFASWPAELHTALGERLAHHRRRSDSRDTTTQR